MIGSWRYSWISVLAAALALLPGPTLSLDTAELEELETLLRDLGFDPGPVDGVVDEETIEAIRRYQEFAALPGEPEPSAILLSELRGVAAAFAALSTTREETPPATTPPGSSEEQPAADEAEDRESDVTEAVAEKVVVPPPPPPPKLKPAAPPEPEPQAKAAAPAAEEGQEPAAAEPPPQQTAELPPAQAPVPESPEGAAQAGETPTGEPPADAPGDDAAIPLPTERPDPEAAAQARIDAEIAPFRILLNSGRLSREELAKRFNQEGRQALEGARYNEAILKFSVAIHLSPNFAGAYSNRGTAYQRQEEADLAAQDFAKAKQLGFGSMRLRDGSNPFN